MSCLRWILCSSRMFLKITFYTSLLKTWTFNEIKWVLPSSSSLSSEELRLLFEPFCCVRKMYDVLEPDFSMFYITFIWTVVSICRKYSCRVMFCLSSFPVKLVSGFNVGSVEYSASVQLKLAGQSLKSLICIDSRQ
jgi:hypothetical protein